MKLIKNDSKEYDLGNNYIELSKLLKDNFDVKNNCLKCNDQNIGRLVEIIDEELNNQLMNYDEITSQRQLTKHSSSYVRIRKNNVKYIINYRTNKTGNYIYLLNSLLEWLIEYEN